MLNGDLCTVAESINEKGQIVGGSFDCNTAAFLHAFLWEKGGPMVDLNTLVAPGSGLTLTLASSINDRGEIAGQAMTSNGDNHAFLLVPCDDKHEHGEGCEGRRATDATQNAPMSVTQKPTTVTQGSPSPRESVAAIRTRLAHRYPYRGFGTYQPK
jgi:probable HAF family extracellular repeat protein